MNQYHRSVANFSEIVKGFEMLLDKIWRKAALL